MSSTNTKPLSPMKEVDGLNHISVMGEDSIVIGKNLIDYIWTDIFDNFAYSSAFVIITDNNLQQHYVPQFQESFDLLSAKKFSDRKDKPKLVIIAVPPGEKSKSRQVKAQIEDQILAAGFTRDTFILALGGGVIGDLAGFIAATFMRGVRFVQIPTSLLAMVDSSVGGKTAIDTNHGKNLIGAFWQPKRVYMDLNFLKTLPDREFSTGMAEIIKSAAIWSAEEFDFLEKYADKVKLAVLDQSDSNTFQTLLRVVSSSVRMKAHVVTVDERESGLRGLLNFGHTIGHAIEATAAPYLLHGECVSIGCVLEAELSHRLGHLSSSAVSRLSRCFKLYNLPTDINEPYVQKLVPKIILSRVDIYHMMLAMGVDKKNVGTYKRVVILTKLGDTLEEKPTHVDDNIITEVIAEIFKIKSLDKSQIKTISESYDDKGIVLTPPGSKSISNRALILAALSNGVTRLRNLLHSDDTRVMIDALTSMGACKVVVEDDGDVLAVHGNGGNMHSVDHDLFLGNAGTAVRFLTTMTNLAKASENDRTVLTGNSRMKQRPIGPLVDALIDNGCTIEYMENKGFLPLKIIHSDLAIPGGHMQLSASISSQYVSSILMCAPYAKNPITLELIGGQVISQLYIDMTISMMATFGIQVEKTAKNTYYIPLGQYTAPLVYEIESDASSATYPLAIAAITSLKCTVPNIGSKSLQGDARFAVDVLKRMGCQVTQTETSTTVQGPPQGKLLSVDDIDMEPMTDAFLTASVLAAVATSINPDKKNCTRIRGIANQHVKECDRIEAMATELGKLGVRCDTHEDGIDVYGVPLDQLNLQNKSPYIHCYDDHRVAMSMSVLGLAVNPGLVITERRCVGKTWPHWWIVLANKFGVSLTGIDSDPDESILELAPKKKVNKSIVLVGMRGVGKTTLGKEMASILDYTFVDMDQHLEEKLGKNIPEIINDKGWDYFRTEETLLLKAILSSELSSSAIISCGGGIVETQEAIDFLIDYKNNGGIVLHLYADIEHVSDYLGYDKTRPAYNTGKTPKETFDHRLPLYKKVSSNTLLVQSEDSFGWPQVAKDAIRMSKFLLGIDLNRVSTNIDRSFFLSLTSPDISKFTGLQMNQLLAGCNAVELRVDLLLKADKFANIDLKDDSQFEDFEFYVLQQISMLRRRTNLPIVYTVRTQSQGGAFPNLAPQLEKLLLNGVEYGCEYVDVEMTIDGSLISQIAPKKLNSLIIASYHDTTGLDLRWDSPNPNSIIHTYIEIAKNHGDILKLISVALQWDDNLRCLLFTRRHMVNSNMPIIAINMGKTGQYSRIMNPFLTPVTHPLLPTAAAPGQLSALEINTALSIMGAIPSRKFFLLGDPISASPSPIMHNTAFKTLGLPHTYHLYPVDLTNLKAGDKNYDLLASLIRSSEFGGASVTIPNKKAIIDLIDELTPAAKIIGAVNTITVVNRAPEPSQTAPATSYLINPSRIKLVGDNTDYLGIARSLNRANKDSLSPQIFGSNTTALVIGAGGTTRAALYALYTMKINKIYLYNRTVSKAEELAKELYNCLPNIKVIPSLESVADRTNPDSHILFDLIISTIPADNDFKYPESLFDENKTSKIALDMAYKPTITPLLEQSSKKGWVTVSGFQVLVDQGIEQFERWTQTSAPQSDMQQAVVNHMRNQ
ncbi:hypothetical protein BB561_002019 [Smittium simulii]|uniref:Pentafunctional AROM polypeptide n=1 Tax=Smittium simulii TaxID=133385 RepID=A0A2T9YSA5_9FUNG|nr:hypothetical protein BB561_002019 [Smittium simulii]